MGLIDLHCHSSASDGTSPPEQLALLAREAGLVALGLTDHDTVAGLPACARGCQTQGVAFVPGIEVSVDPGKPRGTMHILGYFIRDDEPKLLAVTEELQAARRQRNPQIIERLKDLGVDITLEEVLDFADGSVIGRPHIAGVLIAKGYAKTIKDAFSRYIGEGAPAYQRKDRISAERAIDAIHAAGGLAVLAHPIQLKYDDDVELAQTVARLKDVGLNGVEVWHPDHTPALSEQYHELARRYDLLVTGGSDFHGSRKQIALGQQRVDESVYHRLREAWQETQ